ncbi:hypothetical protein OHU34_43820 (plasmid) [Streptomyces sp. NBC_00080]
MQRSRHEEPSHQDTEDEINNLLDGDRDAGGKADGEYEWLR